jgi:CRISPR/Cas system-associated endonuclease Cas3-HD
MINYENLNKDIMKVKKEKTFRRSIDFPLEMREFFQYLKKNSLFVNNAVVECVMESPRYKKFKKEENGHKI